MLNAHEQLRAVILRYTPTMLDVVSPASPPEISRLAAAAGALPESYRDFLGWMGNTCPFLDAEELAYSPQDLCELVYDEPGLTVPDGFIWIGIDQSGAEFNVFIRRTDDAVVRAGYYRGVKLDKLLIENTSIASFLLTSYVRKTLAPSHPLHFSAAFQGDEQRTGELWSRVHEACSHFEIPYRVDYPDSRLYGGNEFVIGVHQRPTSSVVNLHFGAVERAQYEVWYDLVYARWRLLNMPA